MEICCPPLLFDLVADGMAGILKAIARKGDATGLFRP
jgi:hypothetical protein